MIINLRTGSIGMNNLLKIINLKRSSLLVSALLIAACGGGGGGSTDTDNSNNNSQQNTQIVDFSTKTDAEITALAGNAVNAGGIEDKSDSLENNSGSPIITPCDNQGGTIDSQADASGYGTYTFLNCTLTSSSITINGQFIYGRSNVTGFDDFFTFNTVKIAESVATFTLNGELHESTTTDGVTESGKLSINGKPFTLIIASSKLNGTFTFNNFDESYTDDLNAKQSVTTISYTVSSSNFGGTLTVKTITPVKHRYIIDDYPYEGVYEITDGQGGKVVATIQGSGLATGIVNLQIDKDGDGTFESSNDVTWSEFAEKLS